MRLLCCVVAFVLLSSHLAAAGVASYPSESEYLGATAIEGGQGATGTMASSRSCWILSADAGEQITVSVEGEPTTSGTYAQVVLYQVTTNDDDELMFEIVSLSALAEEFDETSLEYWTASGGTFLLTVQLVDENSIPVDGSGTFEFSLSIQEVAEPYHPPSPSFEDYQSATELEPNEPIQVEVAGGVVFYKFEGDSDLIASITIQAPQNDGDWVLAAAYLVDTTAETVVLDRLAKFELPFSPSLDSKQSADLELLLPPRTDTNSYLIAIWSPMLAGESFTTSVQTTVTADDLKKWMEDFFNRYNIPASDPHGVKLYPQTGVEQPIVPVPEKWQDPLGTTGLASACRWKIEIIRNYPDLLPQAVLPAPYELEGTLVGGGTYRRHLQGKDKGFARGKGFDGWAYAEGKWGYRACGDKEDNPDVDFTGEYQGRVQITATAVGQCIHKAKGHGFSALHAGVSYSEKVGIGFGPLVSIDAQSTASAFRHLNATPLFNTPIHHFIVAARGRKQKFTWNLGVSFPGGVGVSPKHEVEIADLENNPAPTSDERISQVVTTSEVVVLCHANAKLRLKGTVGRLWLAGGHQELLEVGDTHVKHEPAATADLAFCHLSLICQPAGNCNTRTVIKFSWSVGWSETREDMAEQISTDGSVHNPEVTHTVTATEGEDVKSNTMKVTAELRGQ